VFDLQETSQRDLKISFKRHLYLRLYEMRELTIYIVLKKDGGNVTEEVTGDTNVRRSESRRIGSNVD